MTRPMIARFAKSFSQPLPEEKRSRGGKGELIGYQGKMFRNLLGSKGIPLNSQTLKTEQTNTSILYEDTFYFKLFRNLREGINPDQEIVQFLTEKAGFENIPPFAGSLEYQRPGSEPITLGLLQGIHPQPGGCLDLYPGRDRKIFRKGFIEGRAKFKNAPKAPVSFFDLNLTHAVPPARGIDRRTLSGNDRSPRETNRRNAPCLVIAAGGTGLCTRTFLHALPAGRLPIDADPPQEGFYAEPEELI